MIEIPIYFRDGSLRCVTQVDDAFADLRLLRWTLVKNRYVIHYGKRKAGQPRDFILMHRHVLGLAKGDPREGDHEDGDPLNNQRSNLRVVDRVEQLQNVPSRGGTSRYRGVSRDGSKWKVRVKTGGICHYLGMFADEDEAGRVANEFRRHHLPFSNDEGRDRAPRRKPAARKRAAAEKKTGAINMSAFG